MSLDDQTQRVIDAWIAHARSDLALARSPYVPGTLPAAYAFLAQQSAEKALKAVLIRHGIDPPRTHNIRDLIGQIERETPDRLPRQLHQAAHELTQYAVESRYPDMLGDVPPDDAKAAANTADEIVEWAIDVIGPQRSA